jgi:hypothetical protein
MDMYTYLNLNKLDPSMHAQFWELFFSVEPDPLHSSIPASVQKSYLRELLRNAAAELELASDMNFLLAVEGSQAVARLSMNRSLHDPSVGYFGCFDFKLLQGEPVAGTAVCDPATVSHGVAMASLLEQAELWFRQKSISKILGPVCLSTWFPYRLQMEEFQGHVFPWEPRTPAQYAELLSSQGYHPEFRYGTFCVNDLVSIQAGVDRWESSALAEGFSFKTLNPEELASNMRVLHELTLETFQGNFLFETLSFRGFAKLYQAGQSLQGTRVFVDLVYGPDSAPAGFMLSQVEDGHLVLKTMGIVKQFRRHGLAFGLASRAIRAGIESHCDRLVGALVFEGGKSTNWWLELTRPGKPVWEHKYALFSKEIGDE